MAWARTVGGWGDEWMRENESRPPNGWQRLGNAKLNGCALVDQDTKSSISQVRHICCVLWDEKEAINTMHQKTQHQQWLQQPGLKCLVCCGCFACQGKYVPEFPGG